MFAKDEKTKSTGSLANQQNFIAQGTKITGDIESQGAFRIDGTLEGTLKTEGKVVLGKQGVIQGTLEVVNADIEGTVTGKLILSGMLSLKSTAVIEGEVMVGKLAVEPGATFNATCVMKSQEQKLKGEREKKQSA